MMLDGRRVVVIVSDGEDTYSDIGHDARKGHKGIAGHKLPGLRR